MIDAVVLSEEQISAISAQASSIAASASKNIGEESFVFFAAFDGTNNDRNNVSGSGNPYDTNVARLSLQVEQSQNVQVGYYAGPGTGGTLTASSWLSPQVTSQILLTAQQAYEDFTVAAVSWLDSHPGGDVTTAITGFSRGGVTAAVFSQLLFENGLVHPTSEEVIIPPGEVGVSAGIIFDPVGTGFNGNISFAPNVTNVTVVQAQNEYRYLFKGVDFSECAGVETISVFGNHCDIGGGYDNGIAALVLASAVNFLEISGIPMGSTPASRLFDHLAPVVIHDEGKIDTVEGSLEKWGTYYSAAENINSPRLVAGLVDSGYMEREDFNEYYEFSTAIGRDIEITRETDELNNYVGSTVKVYDVNGHYMQRTYSSAYEEIKRSWTDDAGSYWNFDYDGAIGEGFQLNNGNMLSDVKSVASGHSIRSVTDGVTRTYILSLDGTVSERIENADETFDHSVKYINGDYYIENLKPDGSSEYSYKNGDLIYSRKKFADGSITQESIFANGDYDIEINRADGSSEKSYRSGDLTFSKVILIDGSITQKSIFSNGDFNIEVRGADGSSDHWYQNGTATYRKIVDNDGSFIQESNDGLGNTYFESRGLNGSSEIKSQNGTEKYHKLVSEDGVVSITTEGDNGRSVSLDDGVGNTSYDYWSADLSREQHNWSKDDGTFERLESHSDGYKNISRKNVDKSVEEILVNADGSGSHTTNFEDGKIVRIIYDSNNRRDISVTHANGDIEEAIYYGDKLFWERKVFVDGDGVLTQTSNQFWGGESTWSENYFLKSDGSVSSEIRGKDWTTETEAHVEYLDVTGESGSGHYTSNRYGSWIETGTFSRKNDVFTVTGEKNIENGGYKVTFMETSTGLELRNQVITIWEPPKVLPPGEKYFYRVERNYFDNNILVSGGEEVETIYFYSDNSIVHNKSEGHNGEQYSAIDNLDVFMPTYPLFEPSNWLFP